MEHEVSDLLDQYDEGQMSRRQLVAGLTAAVGLAAAATPTRAAESSDSTFKATGLDHIALSVTDVARSRDFYVQHLGLKVASERLPNQCFLDCGPDFVALFRSSTPGMHHYSYAIPHYNQKQAAEKLRAVEIEPSLQGGRIYFPDPDGLTVQLSSGR